MTLDHLRKELTGMEAVMASIPSSISIDCTGFNAERIDDAIEVLSRVSDQGRAFSLSSWYGRLSDHMQGDAPITEESLHECGTSACAVGWIATTQKWRDAGGSISRKDRVPVLPGLDGELLSGIDAAECWFGIPRRAASAMFIGGGVTTGCPYTYSISEDRRYESTAYTKYSPYARGDVDLDCRPQVTAADVVAALKQIRTTGALTCNRWITHDLPRQIEFHKNYIARLEQE